MITIKTKYTSIAAADTKHIRKSIETAESAKEKQWGPTDGILDTREHARIIWDALAQTAYEAANNAHSMYPQQLVKNTIKIHDPPIHQATGMLVTEEETKLIKDN